MSVHGVLYDAVGQDITPGAAAAVIGGRGEPLLEVTTGRLGWTRRHGPVSRATPYDLASLTKLLSTTLLSAIALEAGKLSLDEEPWPTWPGVTVGHALRHDGGLVPWAPLYEEAIAHRAVGLPSGKDLVVRAAQATPPRARPGEEVRYADLGFIALGALLEERLGDRLDRLFAEAAAERFGRTGLRYVPIFEEGYAQPIAKVAPTERCPWRGRVIQGQVHDDNAFAMGGIAGHAGLFGDLRDTVRAGLALLEAVRDGGDPIAARLKAFAEEPGARGLGFDRADPEGTTGGALSDAAVGHLGFTGTSLWVDPAFGDDGAVFVLLTNRVHESRERGGIADLRRAFHREAAAWLRAQLGR